MLGFRFLVHLLLVLSVSGVMPPAPDSHAASAGPSRRDSRARLAMRLGLRPAANGVVTASEVSDLGVAARTRLSAQPGECGPSGLPLVLTAADSPLVARRAPVPSALVDGRPLRGPPPAASFL